MRRLIILTILSLASICMLAVPPRLACETLFDQEEFRTEKNTIVISNNPESYFRKIKTENNKDLTAHIKKLVEIDRKRATNSVEGFKNGNNYIILNIPNNERIINIGFWWNDDGYADLFVESQPEAFK